MWNIFCTFAIPMIVIEPQEGENLEKMLRRYKRKFDKLNIAKEVRFRMFYVSKAAQRRETIKRAQWRQKVLSENI